QAVAAVTARDVHDEAQVRQHQLTSRVEVAAGLQLARELELLFTRQHRDARHAFDVGFQASDRTGKNEIGTGSDQSSVHFEDMPPVRVGWEFSSRVFGVLRQQKVPPWQALKPGAVARVTL